MVKKSLVKYRRIGKYSELLSITDDPLQYAKDYVAKLNEDNKKEKESMNISMLIDLSKKFAYSSDIIAKSKVIKICYICLQSVGSSQLPFYYK